MKYGMQAYMLCDSSKAYCCKFELYTGKSATPPIQAHSACRYLGKGYQLYVDNYYSSPQLFYKLFLQPTRACETLRTNHKGTPRALRDAILPHGSIFTMNNGSLNCMKFGDRKVVTFLTSIQKGNMWKLFFFLYKMLIIVWYILCTNNYCINNSIALKLLKMHMHQKYTDREKLCFFFQLNFIQGTNPQNYYVSKHLHAFKQSQQFFIMIFFNLYIICVMSVTNIIRSQRMIMSSGNTMRRPRPSKRSTKTKRRMSGHTK
jgi:hypothetical protein